MKKLTLVMITLVFGSSFIVMSCNNQNDTKALAPGNNITIDSMIKRGEYLVTIMGCDDCHTPKKTGAHGPEPDMALRFSGHPSEMPLGDVDPKNLKSWILFNQSLTAFVGPWGVSYAANLTADESGIGTWSEAQFIKAMREGKLKGMDNTRQQLPPMPWPNFAKASDQDLKAIFAFLKSTKRIENVVPAPIGPDKLASLKSTNAPLAQK